MYTIFRKLVAIQVRLSRWFDRYLSAKYSMDGSRHYLDQYAPRYLRPGSVVWDIGGGKNPFVDLETKRRLGLKVTGLDISQAELNASPAGVYDRTVCTDITTYSGQAEADIVFCNSVLEHVTDTSAALASIEQILNPGGCAVLFVPSSNAAYARLNLLLPKSLKPALLFAIFPEKRRNQGFPAYYDRCTPGDFRMSEAVGLRVEDLQTYRCSAYFTCCFPIHFFWRLWLMVFTFFAGEQAAETFSISLRKPGGRTVAAEQTQGSDLLEECPR